MKLKNPDLCSLHVACPPVYVAWYVARLFEKVRGERQKFDGFRRYVAYVARFSVFLSRYENKGKKRAKERVLSEKQNIREAGYIGYMDHQFHPWRRA